MTHPIEPDLDLIVVLFIISMTLLLHESENHGKIGSKIAGEIYFLEYERAKIDPLSVEPSKCSD